LAGIRVVKAYRAERREGAVFAGGVQRLLREQGVRFVQNVWQPGAPQPAHQPPEDAEAATRPGATTEPGAGGATPAPRDRS